MIQKTFTITYDKDLAIFVPSTTADTLDHLDVELGVQLRDTFANNNRLYDCVTSWEWITKPYHSWVLKITIHSTYERMPSKVRKALENDIKETLKELSSGLVVIKSEQLGYRIN